MDSPRSERGEPDTSSIDVNVRVTSGDRPGESGISGLLSQGRRPFEVVLTGGAPWGFALNGGKNSDLPLHITKIVAGGKASNSALLEGDYILRINELPCCEVGEALDIMDTCSSTLSITVLRGHVQPPGVGVELPPARPPDPQTKYGYSQRYSDDSIIYKWSSSRQLQADSVKLHKRRGDSFNFGTLNRPKVHIRSGSVRGNPTQFDHQSSNDTHQSVLYDRDNRPVHNDNCRSSSPVHEKDDSTNMNRKRSEGPTANNLPSSIQQQHNQQQLLSVKSSPNLAKTGDEQTDSDSRMNRGSSREQLQLVKSSPSLVDNVNYQQHNMDVRYSSDVPRTSDFTVKQSGYGDFGDRTYSVGVYTSDMGSSRQNMRRSLPAHSLQRYQPDYENISHLGTAPLRSEKISEIDDIDEVTSRDSNPPTPDLKEYDPFRGAGLPTRDPASLKYIKVNQNHEKYPSWPVTKSNGATEQTQPINSRALSMTDHTNTSTEFPKKQQLAYTPGLRPLPEKNSPTSERKTDDSKSRNGSDPGFKSEFVFGRYGRVERRNHGNTEGKFDDFYNNSKPGYPPPNMDPDGRNIGDKGYNAPSPPEKDSKGVDQIELSRKLGNIGGSINTDIGDTPAGGKRGPDLFRPQSLMNISPASSRVRPSELRFNINTNSYKQNVDSTDAGTSPRDKGSPLSNPNQRASGIDGPLIQQNRHSSFYDGKQSSSQRDGEAYPSLASPNKQNQLLNQPILRWRPASQRDQSDAPAVHRDRASSAYDRSPSYVGKTDISNFPDSGDKNKTFIVKSTPYYNTSTQTEMLPYAIKISDPSSAAARLKHAETQVEGFPTEASPKKAQEEQRKLFEEKSIQARMSRDFEQPELNKSNHKQSRANTGQNDDFFRYQPTMSSSGPSSPFKGIQSIHAKYATDELYDTNSPTENYKPVIPSFSDNASILRKLSEEFYGNKLALMPDKRISSSSSQESPRFDAFNPHADQQPGMREAESYSSVVIHHDQKSGPFGGDDVSSVSSIADSRHDISSILLDSSSNFKSIDMLSTRGRGSLDASYPSQKVRTHQQDYKISSSTAAQVYNREMDGPTSGSNFLHSKGMHQSSDGKVHSHSAISGSGASSILSNPKSASSEPMSSHSTTRSSSGSSTTSGPLGQMSSSSLSSSSAQPPEKQTAILNTDKSVRLESDSVFIADDDRESDDMSDYEFSRKPSMRKAYGIYDETERLISQSKVLSQTSKSASERQAAQSGGGNAPLSAVAPTSRVSRYSESQGLGRIQEESDIVTTGNDFDNPIGEKVGFVSGKSALEKVSTANSDKLEKYPWQNEAWLKSHVSLPMESNLRRSTSEQINSSKPTTNLQMSSYDTESVTFQRNDQSNARKYPAQPFPSSDNMKHPSYPSSDLHSTHSRTRSEDLPRLNTETAKLPQQDLQRYYDLKPDQSNSGNRPTFDPFLPSGGTQYESITGKRASSDSVADVICKVNENLAKSAERVDSIRRSNSSSSRNSSDYVDMTRDRNRRETDWTRLRTSSSMRYSPDNDRRSSRSSFASENLYEDISAFSASTPRSSFAENADKILDTGNSNASMDSGLVASPTYQNFPYQRRPPPLPPRSPSPDETPPALPPRKYRDQQQSNNVDTTPTSTTTHIQPVPPGYSSEKNGVSVTPVGKLHGEDNQVDRTKRDFKSLMTQWENSTPREDKYAAELRKQAQKLSSNQHQHANPMPASYERTRTKISFSTTYKHEPMQPQEATSPLSSSLPPSSQPSLTPTTSSIPGTSYPSSTSSPSSSQPPSGFHASTSKSNIVLKTSRPDVSLPSPNVSSPTNEIISTRNMPYNSASNTGYGPPGQSKLQERTKLAEDFRNRSGSDVLHSKPPISGGSESANRGHGSVHHYPLRERSSSEHDILSDKRPSHPSYQQGAPTNGQSKDGVSKWRPNRAGGDILSRPAHTQVEIVSMRDADTPGTSFHVTPGRGDAKISDQTADNEGFADESYIGHKNKSSRAIGTYKRSKSAVVLESSSNSSKVDGDPESVPFQEPKLGQQSWSSESVLSHTETAAHLGEGSGDSTSRNRIGAAPEYRNETSEPSPVRPARSSAHGRYSLGQLQTTSLASSTSFYQNNNSPQSTGGHLTSQPGNDIHRDSPQRVTPAALSNSSYDQNLSTSRDNTQQVPRSTNNQQRTGEGSERGNLNNVAISHNSAPTKTYPNNIASGITSWSPHSNNIYAATSSPLSGQDGITSRPGDNGLPNDSRSDLTSQRDYQRRESAPVRFPIPANSPDSRLDVPLGESPVSSRRRSDSSVNSSQRGHHGNYDSSTSSHIRQPSQEELDCDEKAQQLAHELADKDQKLSEVLRLDANKKRMQYMDGLFSESMEATSPGDRSSFGQERRASMKTRSPQHTTDFNKSDAYKRSSLPKEYWMSPSKALLEMELRKNEETSRDLTKDINDSSTLMKHKEELLEKLHKKLEVLKEEKLSLQQEISDNNLLGKQVFETVEAKCQSHSEKDKIKAFIDDLEKIVRLLLNLSGQLARAENAVQSLGPQVDAKLKKLTIDKRERLFAKHEEAKFLKDDIDKRSDQLSGVLRDRLNERELSNYTHFIKMKSKLTIELQELDDKITLGEEQILELKKSIPDVGSTPSS